ncbi:MAG: Beta-glucanase [Dehalococcoidia bacterium]|nr:Beta-glucanase [Bacillota bacterium]
MKKLVLLIGLMFFLAGGYSQAGELDLNGNFTEIGKDNLPAGWVQHSWSGFKPFAKLKLVPGENAGEKALLIYDNKAEHGTAIRTAKRIPAAAGDKITISVKCKGTGTGQIGIYTYSPQEDWCGFMPMKHFELSDNWRTHQFEIIVLDGKEYPTGYIDIVFGAKKDTEAAFSSIKVLQEKRLYAGSLNFPRNWTVFLPIDPKFVPSPEQLKTIPSEFGKAGPRAVTLVGNEIDFAPLFGSQKPYNCAWAFAEIYSPFDCEYTLGAGADWWMQYFVNGEVVIDTMSLGNKKFPYQINNHIVDVKLKKGRNILAVKFVSGLKSSILVMGGPNELRSLTSKIEIIQSDNMDDYDESAKRPGSPVLIKGNPAPGILILTGQGVYTAAPEVKIYFPGKTFTLPKTLSSRYFATGIRLQSFGRQSRIDSLLSIDIVPVSGRGTFSFQINHRKNSDIMTASVLETTVSGETSVFKQLMLPYAILPVDIVLAANQGSYIINLNSLVDSSFRDLSGESALLKQLGGKPFQTGIVFKSAVLSPAEMVVDNYFTGTAGNLVKSEKIPLKIDRFSTFDPRKANWKLVFSDEFNGTKVDWDKWFVGGYDKRLSEELASLDGKGNLLIKTDFGPDGKELMSSALWSKKTFGHGYFEARLRFTKQPGWWAAFWLNGPNNTNPLLDGFEIDIFEDYYTRPREKGGPVEGILDHNLHVFTGGLLKSWNYNSKLPGGMDDFYVLGVKWTPFEISYYLNGRLIESTATHSPYNSVTFDAVNHAFGITPLHVIVSGQIGSMSGFLEAKDGKFPEYFVVDYVRVYEYPTGSAPRVTWAKVPSHEIVAFGEKIILEAKVESAAESKSPIKRVYLFSNGYLIDYKEKPPYKFELAIDKQHYENTPYMAPGRSGKKPVLDGYPHSFIVAAQDENGSVGYSPVHTIIPAKKGNEPYRGKAQVIPGVVKVGHYDEGGNNVAYYDLTPENTSREDFRLQEGVDCGENVIGHIKSGEWIKYTVDIKESGEYDVTVRYGSPAHGRIRMLLDGKPLGEFKLHYTGSFECNELAHLRGLKLPAGRHTITLLLIGKFNVGNIEFKKVI